MVYLGARDRDPACMDDLAVLTEKNVQFIHAFRLGSWELLAPLLSPAFRYLDGATGQLWDIDTYIEDLRANPLPDITIDQLIVHIDGDVATVSARTSARPGQFNRYLDSYQRRDGDWTCYHACVWPLPHA